MRTTASALRAAVVRVLVAVAACLAVLVPSAAQAHSLGSSTISTRVTGDGVDATISIAVDTLDQALGTSYSGEPDVASYAGEVTTYLADHLSVTSADGTEWPETFTGVARETVEGIDTVSVDVAFDPTGTDTSGFVIQYDAVIEALPDHEAVVVLTDPSGSVSTPGVLTSGSDTVGIGELAPEAATGAVGTGLLDMVGYGFHHVLDGADHLLFLAVLLLTAPVAAAGGRWRPRMEVVPTIGAALGIVTSFTVGHSATLIASALGWVDIPTRPVEVLVALSVGVAAVHAVRPLVRRGENVIAAGFGLVHGLAFAGILDGLGLQGTTSLLALLAFNLGVELSQLAATLALFPSLYLLARTRFYPAVRVAGGVLGVLAATGWVLERLGVLTNPLAGLETVAVAHPSAVALALALAAAAAWRLDRRAPRRSRRTARAGLTGVRPSPGAGAP